jgi:starch synthase
MLAGGASYADAISFGDDKVDKKLVDTFAKVKGKKVIPYQAESDLTEYLQLYSDLANK